MRENYFYYLAPRHYRVLESLDRGKNTESIARQFEVKERTAKRYIVECREIAEEEGYGKVSIDTILQWYRERREWMRSPKTYGSIEGILENDHPTRSPEGYRVRDALTGRSVPVYFATVTRGEVGMARGSIGKRVYVFGMKKLDEDGWAIAIAATEPIFVFPPDDLLPSIDEMVGILG